MYLPLDFDHHLEEEQGWYKIGFKDDRAGPNQSGPYPSQGA